MATETCVFCGQDCTPWYWIESKQGNSCKNCGEQAKNMSELTEDQVKKAREIALDGATPEEVEAIRKTQDPHFGPVEVIEVEETFDPHEVVEYEPVTMRSGDYWAEQRYQDALHAHQQILAKTMSVPKEFLLEKNLSDYRGGRGIGKTNMTMTEALETQPQKTVRLLRKAAEELNTLASTLGPNEEERIKLLTQEMQDHADTGVLAPDEYEMAVTWLSQQSKKPPRFVRRVLKSKLNVEK